MGCKQSKAVIESVVQKQQKNSSHVVPEVPEKKKQQTKSTSKEAIQNDDNVTDNRRGRSQQRLKRQASDKKKDTKSFKNKSYDDDIPLSHRIDTQETVPDTVSLSEEDCVYKLLVDCHVKCLTDNICLYNDSEFIQRFRKLVTSTNASYQSTKSKSTPLHVAVQLLDTDAQKAGTVALSSSSSPTSSTPRLTAAESSSSMSSRFDSNKSGIVIIIDELIRAYPGSLYVEDCNGNIPLHYVIAPTTKQSSSSGTMWRTRTAVLKLLLAADRSGKSIEYLRRNDVAYKVYNMRRNNTGNESDDSIESPCSNSSIKRFNVDKENGGCSPLYRAIQGLPDDFSPNSPTMEFIHVLVKAATSTQSNRGSPTNASFDAIGCGNSSDGDKPLALLYRRFTRQFDVSEKFFAGDNSRPEVIQHRANYKQAAGNTWKLIDMLLQYQTTNSEQSLYEQHEQKQNGEIDPSSVHQERLQPTRSVNSNNSHYRTVHRAVQGETPPDLLRYIIETNAEDLTVIDEFGNLPLHYAAKAERRRVPLTSRNNKQLQPDYKASFPAFYSKYVIDELLYKYQEAASVKDRRGLYPLTLAVQSGKQWIGGGIKSLYETYPDALQQVNLQSHASLRRAMSLDNTYNDAAIDVISDIGVDEDETPKEGEEKIASDIGVIQDEFHDAIMLVQQDDVDTSEVVASMWAHEEDPGVQMLGCVALARLVAIATHRTMRDLAVVPSVSFTGGPSTDDNETHHTNNMDDVMRIALSSIPAIVNAMKAHPNEVIVQEKACLALKAMAWSDGKREISFVASGAVAAVVGAMQAHVSDPGVQEAATGCIGKVIKYGGPDRATVVASVSGLTAIINAMAAHPTSPGIQYNGCRALCELTEYDNANLPDIPRAHTEPLLEAAKERFPEQCSQLIETLLSRLS